MKRVEVKVFITILIVFFLIIIVSNINIRVAKQGSKIAFYMPFTSRLLYTNYCIDEMYNVAQEYLNKEDYKKAYASYKNIIDRSPSNIYAYKGIAVIYALNKNYKLSKKYINLAESLLNTNSDIIQKADIYLYKAKIYSGSSPYDGIEMLEVSIEYFLKTIEVASKMYDIEQKNDFYREAYYFLTDDYTILFNIKEAINAYEKLLIVEPTYTTLYSLISRMYLLVNDIENAKNYLEKCKNVYGANDDRYLIALAKCHLYNEEFGEAYDIIENKIRRSEVTEPYIYMLWGEYYEKLNNISEAKKFYLKAFNIDKSSIRTVYYQRIITRLDIDVSDLENN